MHSACRFTEEDEEAPGEDEEVPMATDVEPVAVSATTLFEKRQLEAEYASRGGLACCQKFHVSVTEGSNPNPQA